MELAIQAVAQLDLSFEKNQGGIPGIGVALAMAGQNSSFSLEDLPSNRVGVQIAKLFLEQLSDAALSMAVQSGNPVKSLLDSHPTELASAQKQLLGSLGAFRGSRDLIMRSEVHGPASESGALWLTVTKNESTRPIWHPTFSPIDRGLVPSWLDDNLGQTDGCFDQVTEP